MENLANLPLELLTQRSVLLMVHFARLEIELQLTYSCVQCVFLLQQTCSARCTGTIFTTRPWAAHARSTKKSRGTDHNTHNKDHIEHQKPSSGIEVVPPGTGAQRCRVHAAERSGHSALVVPTTMTRPSNTAQKSAE